MSHDTTFRPIPFGSDDYQQECNLRHAVLRAPLGLNLFDEDLSPEQHQEHFGLFDPSGAIVACVIAVRVSPDKAKIRQMAVHLGHQRQGHGQRIMRLVEQHLTKAGVRRTVLHARETAIGFYESLGYHKFGEPFIEVGIPHVAMEKPLNETPTTGHEQP